MPESSFMVTLEKRGKLGFKRTLLYHVPSHFRYEDMDKLKQIIDRAMSRHGEQLDMYAVAMAKTEEDHLSRFQYDK